jgi:vacuolar-type H+-ATPase subunit E/Vma4
MREIFGPVKENAVWTIRTNQELMDLYREQDIITEIRKEILRWLGHVERKPEERTVKKVFKNIPEGKWSVGKPRKRWLDDVENDLKKMGVKEAG